MVGPNLICCGRWSFSNLDDNQSPKVTKNPASSEYTNTVINYNFNPIEKIVELYDELLKSEKEKIALLESMLNMQEGQPKKK